MVAQLRLPLGAEAFSPLAGHPLILLDMASRPPVNNADLALCRQTLPRLPCPIIGLGARYQTGNAELDGQVNAMVDTLLASPREAAPLIRNIRKSPLSAAVLVQLLRHNEHASLEDGLLAESLAYSTLQGGAEFLAFLTARATPLRPTDSGEYPAVRVRPGRAGEIHITLNRPRRRNAFSIAMRDGLVEALQLLDGDSGIGRALIDGAGSCFCVGGDLDEFGLAPDTATAHAVRSTRNAGRMIDAHAEHIEFHLHGACIGSGIELPAFARKITARPGTFFQLPEITMGLVPGAGGTVSILRRIGRHRSAWMALSGRRVKAATALQWGLIDAID